MRASPKLQPGAGNRFTSASATTPFAVDSVRPDLNEELELAEGIKDRDLHDEVIRYLTDAKLRSIDTNSKLLEDSEAKRAIRFSHFLARRYYRDRLQRGFRYSTVLVSPAQRPELVVEGPRFNSILKTCTLGSLETSLEVGHLALEQELRLRQEEWWSELLDYELAFFIQLATSETALPAIVPARNPSAMLQRFRFRIPELLRRLKAGETIMGDVRGEVMLLFSRNSHGKIYVVEADERTEAVFHKIDGNKNAEEIATSCGLPLDYTRRILSTLSDIGTIVLPAR